MHKYVKIHAESMVNGNGDEFSVLAACVGGVC